MQNTSFSKLSSPSEEDTNIDSELKVLGKLEDIFSILPEMSLNYVIEVGTIRLLNVETLFSEILKIECESTMSDI